MGEAGVGQPGRERRRVDGVVGIALMVGSELVAAETSEGELIALAAGLIVDDEDIDPT